MQVWTLQNCGTFWRNVFRLLDKTDLANFKVSCKFFRSILFEYHKLSNKSFIKILDNCCDPRYLIQIAYVPQSYRLTVPQQIALHTITRPDYIEPTPWKASVMSVCANFSVLVDNRSVFHCLDAVDFFDPSLDQSIAHDTIRTQLECPKKNLKACVNEGCECLKVFLPAILDIHFQNFCRGNPQFAEIKAKKRDKPAKQTFGNQCTMRICFGYAPNERKNGQQWDIVNLKLFANGKIQMTGCQSLEQAKTAMEFLIGKLVEKAPAMRAKRNCMRELLQHHSATIVGAKIGLQGLLATIGNNLLQDIWVLIPNCDLFEIKAVCKTWHNLANSTRFWSMKCFIDMRCRVAYDETLGWYVSEKWNGRFNRMDVNRKKMYYPNIIRLYEDYRPLKPANRFLMAEQFERLSVDGIKIVMMNTDFKTNFNLDLKRIFKLLRAHYKEQVPIVEFNPDGYVALNAKYKVPKELIDPDNADDSGEQLLSFFVFSTGSIIINSATLLEQQNEAYAFINRFLKKHYDEVWHPGTSSRSGKRKSKK